MRAGGIAPEPGSLRPFVGRPQPGWGNPNRWKLCGFSYERNRLNLCKKIGLVTRISMAFLSRRLGLLLTQVNRVIEQRHFSISGSCSAIQKLTRVRVVDNSTLGNTPYHRPPKCIHVYNKSGVGKVGDKILLAIKGEKKKAVIVGHRRPGPCMTPRFDSNNVVLIEENGNPTGTRIKIPIPLILRKKGGEFSKVLAIAQNLV
ncbi:large ribosomal subunit protein uL14m isoform X4 [Carettochelys insculpta]|uniref:large ribosomal subunit protein uL14m isoform X4 n=1 Tax=Carettochelys insculpta TaxID=44489 RepID=UPI003EB84286